MRLRAALGPTRNPLSIATPPPRPPPPDPALRFREGHGTIGPGPTAAFIPKGPRLAGRREGPLRDLRLFVLF